VNDRRKARLRLVAWQVSVSEALAGSKESALKAANEELEAMAFDLTRLEAAREQVPQLEQLCADFDARHETHIAERIRTLLRIIKKEG
jgi:hypothetical protein